MGPYGVTAELLFAGHDPDADEPLCRCSPEPQGTAARYPDASPLGQPEDMANLICFLSSDLSSYITGTMIDISGGKFATQMPWMAHRELMNSQLRTAGPWTRRI